MALQNQNNVYLRVTRVDLEKSLVFINLYKDQEVRNDVSEFDLVKSDIIALDFLHSTIDEFNGTGKVKDDLVACGYLALKKQAPYNGTESDTWVDC